MALTVNLIGPSPWGFRIFGGRDFKRAITISKVNMGSKAEDADLQVGDIILEINGENTADMLNAEVQNKIKNSKTQLQLLVERREPSSPGQTNGISSPEQLTGRFQESVIVSRDENQNYREYTISPTSMSPRSLSSIPPGSPAGKDRLTPTLNKSLQLRSWSVDERNQLPRPLSQEFFPPNFRHHSVSSRTPTPPGRYSPHSPIDQDVPMSPRRSSCSSDFAMQKFDTDSEVYKMIQENKESRAAPRQSNAFKVLQEALEADENEAALQFPGKLSPNDPKPSAVVSKQHTCERCGNKIVTQAVRVTDDCFLHPECYTCSICNLNLRMRGHFWVGGVMFCEKHAREEYQGPGAGYRTNKSDS